MEKTALDLAHEYGVKTALAQCGYASTEEVERDVAALGLLPEPQKVANSAGLGSVAGSMVGLGPVGAAIGADSGRGWQAAGGDIAGSLAGGAGGLVLGSILGLLMKDPAAAKGLQKALGLGGALAGGAMGAQHYGEAPEQGLLDRIRNR